MGPLEDPFSCNKIVSTIFKTEDFSVPLFISLNALFLCFLPFCSFSPFVARFCLLLLLCFVLMGCCTQQRAKPTVHTISGGGGKCLAPGPFWSYNIYLWHRYHIQPDAPTEPKWGLSSSPCVTIKKASIWLTGANDCFKIKINSLVWLSKPLAW